MMGRVIQPVLPLLPAQARSIGPSAGLLEGPDGGVVFVFGLATFDYPATPPPDRRARVRDHHASSQADTRSKRTQDRLMTGSSFGRACQMGVSGRLRGVAGRR
jgi:hypothetical protein